MTIAIDPAAAAPSAALAPTRPRWLDPAMYPFAPRDLEIDGHRMRYLDEGKGAPILFVHGTPSWSFEWRAMVAALRADHRCVAPDHLGFGLSDKPLDADLTPAGHAARLRRFVEALDLEDLTLVVHDFGGPIGLPVALDMPERVRSVVVINSWMWAHGDDPNVRRLSRLVASPIGRFLYSWLNASPRWLIPTCFADRSKLTKAMHRAYLGPFGSRHERLAPWVLGCELAGSDPYYAALWERRAPLARVPTTLVWGMADPAFGEAYLDRWRAALPDAAVVTLNGVGHFPQEEAPDAVTDAIRAAARLVDEGG